MNRSFTLASALCLTALTLVACDKKPEGNLTDMAAEAGKSADSMIESASNVSTEAFNTLKTQLTEQANMISTQASTLKTNAMKFKDEQVDGLIAQVESKIADAKKMLSSATAGSEGMNTISTEVTKHLGEAGELIAKATTRLQELTKAATGG